ncbi:hypothetical protein U1Q18_013776, partial [Sarracenia purpurea var. burkii]
MFFFPTYNGKRACQFQDLLDVVDLNDDEKNDINVMNDGDEKRWLTREIDKQNESSEQTKR